MSLHSHFDASTREETKATLPSYRLPLSPQAVAPLSSQMANSSEELQRPNPLQVQWGMLLTQRELLLEEIKRGRRQLRQVQNDLSEYEARFALVAHEIEVFERQTPVDSTAGEESAEGVFTLLRGAN